MESIVCCYISYYINFPTGYGKYVQLFLVISLCSIISLVRMFKLLRKTSVLARARYFLPLASKSKIRRSSVKTSQRLLNFSDLWNQNKKNKNTCAASDWFYEISISLWDIYIYNTILLSHSSWVLAVPNTVLLYCSLMVWASVKNKLQAD